MDQTARIEVPCDKFWGSSPYDMLNALYPNRFSKHMLKGYKYQKKEQTIGIVHPLKRE